MKKLKKLIGLFALIFLLGSIPAQANLYSVDILINSTNQYQAVALSPKILNHAATNALRVINRETNEEVPFFIYTPTDAYATADACFLTESIEGLTTVTLNGLTDSAATLENLKITNIHIDTDSFFKRDVRILGERITLYRSSFQNAEQENTSITLSGSPQTKQVSFTIIDHDDRPINIQSISVEYFPDYIIFRAEAGQEYSLLFGGNLTRPRYDIENFRDLIIQEGFGLAQLQNAMVLIEQSPTERDFTLIFNIAIGVAGVLLAIIAIIAIKKKK